MMMVLQFLIRYNMVQYVEEYYLFQCVLANLTAEFNTKNYLRAFRLKCNMV